MKTSEERIAALKPSDYWRTPPAVVELVERETDWSIVWDTCALEDSRVVPGYWSEADDALEQDWGSVVPPMVARGITPSLWCNPPFSQVGLWVDKAVEAARKGARVLLLTECDPSRTWWMQAAWQSERILVSTHRVRFHDHSGCPRGTGRCGSSIFALSPSPSLATKYGRLLIEPFECRAGRNPQTLHAWQQEASHD